jgi:hypothetical protein
MTQIAETIVTPTTVKLVVVRGPDDSPNHERLELLVRAARDEGDILGDIHQVALRRARDVIDEEIQRIVNLAGPRSK